MLPNTERVAEVAGRFWRARIFDRRDPGGRPLVNRPPAPDAEPPAVLNYLNNGYVVMAGRGFDPTCSTRTARRTCRPHTTPTGRGSGARPCRTT